MPIPTPLILDDVGIEISTDGTDTGLTALECAGTHIELTPDVTVTTLDTFCGSADYPGNVKWSLVATFIQSFDPAATEEVLSAALALDTPTPFRITPFKSQPVSATNPRWDGQAIPQPYAPINGDAGAESTVEIEWSLVGPPVKSIVPPTVMAADLAALSRTELDEMATGLGLNPADYPNKEAVIAAIEAART